ncbi:MAG: tetratricopeptide repeat protein [Sulfurovaceae bacterium]|nr:tetratricopeptide repeat protein [Sulfurovaceae bacterium]
MIKIVFISLFVSTLTHADLFDFIDRHNAKKAYQNREYDKSIAILTLLNKTPHDWYNLGNSYYKERKYTAAIKAYEKAPNNINKYHNLGNCYFQIKDYDNAIKSYQQALMIQKDNDTQYNLELAKKQKAKNNQTIQYKAIQVTNNGKPLQSVHLQEMPKNDQKEKQLYNMLKSLENKKTTTILYNLILTKRSSYD